MNNLTRTLAVTAIAATALTLVGVSAADSGTADRPSAGSSATTAAHWSYEGDSGPSNWAVQAGDYATCGTGARQSPVALVSAPAADGGSAASVSPASIELPATVTAGSVSDTGHTVQFTAAGTGSAVVYDDDTYQFVQMHFHAAAEHTLDGVRHPVELHLVHADEAGDLLVVGVLVTAGEHSAPLEPFVSAATTTAAGSTGAATQLSLASVMPGGPGNYLAYDGSLTTPPCTENVQWIVMTTPAQMSPDQIAAITEVHDNNARPLQPLGARTVTAGTAVVAR